MPVPRWMAAVNKRVFNRWELRRGTRPVLIHTGRTSGRTYETPLDAHAVDGGYIFIVMYGAESDWVQNILAAGTAQLRIEGSTIDLTSPKIVAHDEAWRELGGKAKPPAKFLNVTEYLRLDTEE